MGPLVFVGVFVTTVAIVAVLMWLKFRNRTLLFWRRMEYAYLLFTVIGGAAAAADLALSNWAKDLQQAQTRTLLIEDELKSVVNNGAALCRTVREFNRLRTEKKDEKKNGILNPNDIGGDSADIQMSIPFAIANTLSESECGSLNKLRELLESNQIDQMIDVHNIDSEFVNRKLKELEAEYSRGKDLKKDLSSYGLFSALRNLSPILLGLGIGIRLARTHFDVKGEQSKLVKVADLDASPRKGE